ncbi:MAG: hypothetical protein K0R09_1589 [Clostridiales bacterium]|jgi:hypothetical protein|nr:hypothetical protein [Clostridiales bacterium]
MFLGKTVDIILIDYIIAITPYLPGCNIIIKFYGFIIILLIPIVLIHELIHGTIYTIFGGKVRYGFKGVYAYTQEISEIPIEKKKFVLILLAPLIIISPITILAPNWFGELIFLLNLLGSSGDIYMAITLVKYPVYCKIIDRSYGYDVIVEK